jgi:hypothetical protein
MLDTYSLSLGVAVIPIWVAEEKYSRTCGNTIMIHYTFTIAQNKTAAAVKTATAEQAK